MRALPVLLLLGTTGCGYIGDPLPPALNIPTKVADLKAIQRFDKIVIDFTIPPLTTEGLVQKRLGKVDLRIGTTDPPFRMEAWAASSTPVEVRTDTPGHVTASVLASPYVGQDVIIAARVSSLHGRLSEWSNPVVVRVVSPVPSPSGLKAEADSRGVRLTWSTVGADATYRVLKGAEPVATVDKAEYVDTAAQYGKEYSYSVQALMGEAQSEVTAPVTITPVDKFPPAVPSGLTAIAGVNTIELAWDRNTESDLKSYILYRDGKRLAEILEAPSYSDKQLQSGATHRYTLSAVDRAGNESAQSDAIDVTAP